MSWNIKDFGASRDNGEIKQIASQVRDADILIIQEVVGKHPGGVQAIGRLVDELDRMGTNWDYIYSDPTNSPSSYISERYAYLWKTNKVKLKGGSKLISSLSQVIHREPFYAVFDFKGIPISVLNFHSRKHNDNPDIELSAIAKLLEANEKSNWILAGDFNMSEDHKVFEEIYHLGFSPALRNQPTTLKMKCKNGNYLNHSIDNIYHNLGDFSLVKSGVLDFVEDCSSLPDIRNSLSDHLPVVMSINSRE